MNNDDIDLMNTGALYQEQMRLYNLLNSSENKYDDSLYVRLRLIKEELDSRLIVGNCNSDLNILIKLLVSVGFKYD